MKTFFAKFVKVRKFVLNKKLYTDTLEKHNIPVMDTISFQIRDNMNVENILNKIRIQSQLKVHILYLT